jgi:SAM-dependent methyltransferase/catechol 2,3-dioxygenase-like lactoylglutathione lyase family enzyme
MTGQAVVLTVSSAVRSAAWYCDLFGFTEAGRYQPPGGRVRQVTVAGRGLELCLVEHDADAGRFDESRSGLDHLEFLVPSRDELGAWAARLDALGVDHSGIKEPDYTRNAMITFRDPDNIQLEFFWRARPPVLDDPVGQAQHTTETRAAYDRLAAVWSATTDDGPYNGHLERPAFRSLVPGNLNGAAVLDAGCGSGAQAEWLLGQGADVTGIDVSPRIVEEAERRCGGRGRFLVADLTEPLPLAAASLDGITCSLALHYVGDWSVPLRSFASALRPGGWAVISLDHPAAPPLRTQRGGYFDTELVADTWRKADIEVSQRFWRRPLSAVLGAFADAGFVVDRVAEPQPSPEALRLFPAELGGLAGVPTFIVYRLWLRPA